MRVLHNLTAKKFLIIISNIFLTLILLTAQQIFADAKIPDDKTDSETKDFALPFNLCSEQLSEKTNIQKIASDNVKQIYLFSSDYIISKNLETNATNWESNIISTEIFNIDFDEKYIFVTIQNPKELKLKKISKLTGITIEERKISNEKSLILTNRDLVFTGDESGNIKAFEKGSEKNIWKGKTGGKVTSIILIEEDKILVSSLDNFIYMFSKKNGSLIWKKRLPNRIIEKPGIYKEGFILISNPGDSDIFLIETQTGKSLNRISLPENVFSTSNSILLDKRIIISTNKGVLYFSQTPCKI